MTDNIIDDRPEGTEHVWSAADLAELWMSIIDDACILPSNRRAAYRAALRGKSEWWLAVACFEEDSRGLDSEEETVIEVERPKTIQHT